MPYADLSDVRLYYEREGQGHTVVFIHGHSLDRRMWNGQVQAVSRSYAVLRYDVRGHGLSSAPATGYSMPHYARELHELLEHLGLRRPSIVGLSMGGNIAIEYALTYPDRLETLTLVDSGLMGFEDTGEFMQEMQKRRELVRREGVGEKFVRASMLSALFDGIRHNPEQRALARAMVSGWSGASWRDTTVYPKPERTQADRVHEIRVPTLVLVGELDGPRFHRIAGMLASRIKVMRKYVVPGGAGHIPPMETPEAFNDILLDFLGGAVNKALV